MAAPSTNVRMPAPAAGRPPRTPPARGTHPATLLVLAFVFALTTWNVTESSEHLLTDRDPGVYVTTARWLAREGTVLVDPAVGPFADHPDLGFEEQGWNLDEDGRLEPQFLHLLPVVLAAAHVVGGDGLLLATPALIAGLALLAFHAFSRRVVRPWWALAATVALGVDLVWVHLSRDAFSEAPAVLLLFAGLAVLWEARTRSRPGRALLAGALLGAVSIARVEGFVLLLPIIATAAAELVVAQGGPAAERRRTGRLVAALLVGVALTTGVALADLVLYSSWYLDDLRSLLLAVLAGLVATAALATAAVWASARRRRTRPLSRPAVTASGTGRRDRWWVADAAAVAVIVVGAAAWLVRPWLSTVVGGFHVAIADVQQQEGLAVDGVRRYSEASVQWLSWYVGPLALAAGIVGAALVARRLLASRGHDLRLLPFGAVFATISVLYLWRPSIVPDQIWAMRRYAIVTIPGVLLLATLAGQQLLDRLRRTGHGRTGEVLCVVGVAIAIGFPLATLAPVATATTQAGMLSAVEQVCAAVGDDGAVVVIPGRDLELVAAQTVRSFCGVPAAIAQPAFSGADAAELAAAWSFEGRQLHLLGANGATLEALAGTGPEVVVELANDELLGASLTRRPEALVSVPYRFVVVEVPAGAPAGP